MEQSDLDFINNAQEAISKLDRRAAAETGIHLVMAQMCRKEAELEPGQKVDIISAALELYAAVVLSEFCRVLTTPESGEPYDLLKADGDQEMKKSVIQAGVAHTVVRSEEVIDIKSRRLSTLSEMLFSNDDVAMAKTSVAEFNRRKKAAVH
jgi:hypothetical protein